MKTVRMNFLISAVTLGFCSFSVQASDVTPVQKVIQMLEGMNAKGLEEKRDEITKFEAFGQFCQDTKSEKNRLIDNGGIQITNLVAAIEEATQEASKLSEEISVHEGDIAAWKGDQSAASNVRAMGKADFNKQHEDYSESIDALGGAIATLKTQPKDRAQVSLAQVSMSSFVPSEAKAILDAFLQSDDDDETDFVSPEAHGYSFQSDAIVEMLVKLEREFTEKRTGLEKAETNDKTEHDLLNQELTQQIAQAIEDATRKRKERAGRNEAKALATGDLEKTKETKKSDEEYLADLEATCEQKKRDFNSRQKLRDEETKAINKAIEIIRDSQLEGAADKHLPASFVQKPVLAQLRATVQSEMQARAATYLHARAGELDSRVLEAVAAQMDNPDVFAKVKTMIRALIEKLREESTDEAEHKGWCDMELGANTKTRAKKTDTVAKLTATIEELVANNAKLSNEIAELSKSNMELETAKAKATEMRDAERIKNNETVKDAVLAQQAVSRALAVLHDFYDKAATATVFVQEDHPQIPELFSEDYKGQQDGSVGVLGMLEVIASDFVRLEEDTKAADVSAQKEYDQFVRDTEKSKATNDKDMAFKTNKKTTQVEVKSEKAASLREEKRALETAQIYFDKLKPACVDAAVDYEDRVKRREAEIESLKEALNILNGEV